MKDAFPSQHVNDARQVFVDGGEMGARMRAFDWSLAPLGSPGGWPLSLRTAIGMILSSRHPMYLIWGPEYTQFYNDAYRPILGPRKHPHALGQSARQTYADVWSIISRPIQEVMTTGNATWAENQMLPLERDGFIEESYFTFSYSPIRDESGNIRGLLTVLSETTKSVIGDRRLHTLNALAARIAGATTPEDVCQHAVQTLSQRPVDLPFIQIYLAENTAAHLIARAGAAPAPPVVPLAAHASRRMKGDPWQVAEVLHSGTPRVITLQAQHGTIPGLPWLEPVRQAYALPIVMPGDARPAGVIIAGLSPRLPLDAQYHSFLALLTDDIGHAVAAAHMHAAARARAEQHAQIHALGEMNRRLSDFLGSASHELRTPLTSITANVQLAERMLARDLPPAIPPATVRRLNQAHTLVARVAKEVAHLDRLVDVLLDIACIESDQLDMQMQTVDLREVVRRCVRAQQNQWPNRTITITSAGVPDAPLHVLADAERIGQVVTNYLTNALRFAPPTAPVTISLSRSPTSMRCAVHDQGPGIPVEAQAHVWERFYHVAGVTAQIAPGAGLGLGLFLCKAIIARHHGTVGLSSAPDDGTTFWFELPLAEEDAATRQNTTRDI